jgi:hypothetical protein
MLPRLQHASAQMFHPPLSFTSIHFLVLKLLFSHMKLNVHLIRSGCYYRTVVACFSLSLCS